MKHFLFRNDLVSLPFLDFAGILMDDGAAAKELFWRAIEIGKGKGADRIELRQNKELASFRDLGDNSFFSSKEIILPVQSGPGAHKVRMMLELPGNAEALMRSLKSKLRSQINKPVKEGLTSRIGGIDLLKDFYRVFCINMRDLGSPVHSKVLMANILQEFPEQAKIFVVYSESTPVACSFILCFKDTVYNPWASFLREFSKLSPNMLLYWSMLEFACNNSYKYFDFGRSTPLETTFKFKEQWGASGIPLHWYDFPMNGKISDSAVVKAKFETFIEIWRKILVSVTRLLGPMIRKHIAL